MKIPKRWSRFALLLVAGLVFFTATNPDEPDVQSNDRTPQYYCPPCGCCSDEVLLQKDVGRACEAHLEMHSGPVTTRF